MRGPFNNELVLVNYRINTDKFTESQKVRIVLIADLHSQIYGNEQNIIADIIRLQKPNIIALAGDIAGDVKPISGFELFIKAIAKIAPVFYVTGNHECRMDKLDEIRNYLRNSNVSILENEYKEIKINNADLIIGGVDDPTVTLYDKPNLEWENQLLSGFSDLKNKPQFKILLSHRPELVDLYKRTPFDLILSGHAHGGQFRIPYLLNGLFSPGQGFFPKYAGGLYKYANKNHIVSRGSSNNQKITRIFNPPEIVVIDISFSDYKYY